MYLRCIAHFILPCNSWIHKSITKCCVTLFEGAVSQLFSLKFDLNIVELEFKLRRHAEHDVAQQCCAGWFSFGTSILLFSEICLSNIESDAEINRCCKTDRFKCYCNQSPLLVTGRYLSGFRYDKTLHQILLNGQAMVRPLCSEVRFKSAYELVDLKSLRFSTWYKNCIFQSMDKLSFVQVQRYPLKFHTKYPTHTLKDM